MKTVVDMCWSVCIMRMKLMTAWTRKNLFGYSSA